MEIFSEISTDKCNHCGRDIPQSNIDLHYVHCSRNLERCRICGDMVPKKHAEEHYLNIHAPVCCSLCSETIDREVLHLHNDESCPQRIVTCEYCEFPLPSIDLSKHQEACGNRTEYCHICNKYVRLNERDNHDIQFHSNVTNNIAESSRNVGIFQSEQNHRRRRGPNNLTRLFFTITITGIAIFIGSTFFQRKDDGHPQQ